MDDAQTLEQDCDRPASRRMPCPYAELLDGVHSCRCCQTCRVRCFRLGCAARARWKAAEMGKHG